MKIYWNVRKHRDFKFVTTEARKNYLVSEAIYHIKKSFTDNLLAIEMRKTQIIINKFVHLGLSMLELSKILIYEFCYDYVRPKYGEKAKLCYIDTDSFNISIYT